MEEAVHRRIIFQFGYKGQCNVQSNGGLGCGGSMGKRDEALHGVRGLWASVT